MLYLLPCFEVVGGFPHIWMHFLFAVELVILNLKKYSIAPLIEHIRHKKSVSESNCGTSTFVKEVHEYNQGLCSQLTVNGVLTI